ncbi:MAG: DUF3047 domain-containing protein [Deltaproteobacteria bacterium]|nr:DUF3047 domain-containing protein [Deltaproteobacteria bacterium]
MNIKLTAYASVFVLFMFILVDKITAQEDIIRIARFNQETDVCPLDWQVKEWKGKADVKVISGDAGYVLCLKSNGTSTALYKNIAMDIKEAPYLNWQWKVTKLPEGGDVRKKAADDQAAQIYVIFPRFPSQINSRVIGYIWDTNTPKDSIVTSTKLSNTKYVVLRSGKNELGKWFTEKRNVYADYKMLFNEEPSKMGKVSVMIDSDDTKSAAEAFFGDIYLSRN